MRFICVRDYVNYIKQNPSCNADQLATGVIIGRRVQDDLLDVIKYFINYSHFPATKYDSCELPLTDLKRDIVIHRCIK
jgi:hypothetical protein